MILTKNSQDAEGGPEEIVTSLYVGHFFGETSLVTKAPRNANVIASAAEVRACTACSADCVHDAAGAGAR